MYKISGPRGKAVTFLSSFQKVVVDVVKLFNKYGYLTIQCMTQEILNKMVTKNYQRERRGLTGTILY